jgi:pimeloyl-ACP methyl ester carboxylesterase
MGRRITRRSLLRIVKSKAALTDDLIRAVTVSARRPHAGDAFAATQRVLFEQGSGAWSLTPRLAEIKTPTLIVTGKEDKLVPTQDCMTASTLIPHARFVQFTPCGHWLVRDCPDRFVAEVNGFLDD